MESEARMTGRYIEEFTVSVGNLLVESRPTSAHT